MERSKQPKDLKLIRAKLAGFFVVVTAATLVSALLLLGNTLSEFENRSWDWRLKSTAVPDRHDRQIKIIMIDQASLEFLSGEESIFWPWPRGIYEAITKFLKLGGARAVGFDILFSEPSSYGVEDDEAFAAAVANGPPTVVATALRRDITQAHPNTPEFLESQQKFNSDHWITSQYPVISRGTSFQSITLPIMQLIKSAAAFGNVSALPDSDGVYRHTTAGALFRESPILNLPFALFEAVQPIESANPSKLPFDIQGKLAVNFHGPARTYDTYSFASIVESLRAIEKKQTPTVSPSIFKDSWILIGMDAPGLLDLRPTPLGELYPGVEYHATVLDNLIHKDFAKKSSLTADLVVSFVFVLALATAIIFVTTSELQLGLTLGIILAFFCFQYAAAVQHFWVGLAVPTLAGVIALVTALLFQYKLEGRQHRFIKNVFRNYVSPEVIEEIIRNPASLALGGGETRNYRFF